MAATNENQNPVKEKVTAENGKNLQMPRDNIGFVVAQFIQEIDSLASTLPLAMKSITGARKGAREAHRNFLIENGSERDEKRGTIKIRFDDILRFQRLARRLSQTTAAGILVPRSLLVALVSQYDNFLGLLIEALILTKPDILKGSEKTLSFSELLAFGSIDAARDHIIEKEVESVLRKSHAEQFDWLESTFKIKLREGLSIWPQFIELTERRNLFVHTGGQVSAQYLKVCGLHGVDCSKVGRGDQLRVTPEYFNAAHATLFEIGVKLAHVFWRKLKPSDREKADNDLLGTTYHLLVDEKYQLAKSLLDFSTDVLKEYSSEAYRLRFAVNRVQAYKWSGDFESANKLLGKEDFSALSNEFQIAEAVLRDEFPKALGLVRKIGPEGPIRLGDYREWPLFKELRKQKDLDPVIEEVFGQPLHKIDFPEEPSGIADQIGRPALIAPRQSPVLADGRNGEQPSQAPVASNSPGIES